MNVKKSILFLTLAAGLSWISCNEPAEEQQAEEDQLGTEAIENPKTAQDQHEEDLPLAEMTFEDTEHNFGQIKEGDKVEHVFTFENTGEADLIISNAKASCGCTVPSYTKEPIPPGETGEINVVFNSKGRVGRQNKAITVTANTNPNRKVLYLRGEVVKEENKEQ